MRIATSLGSGIILLLCGKMALSQQLKLGKSPYLVEKSAVLELNADNQGLLLTRISDTTQINALSPPDGMVIFFIPARELLVRSNGYWQIMTTGSAISSLNGLAAAAQTFATGTTGSNFNIVSSGAVHTFNIPDASGSTRGLVTTAGQTFAGVKTFSSSPVFSSLTLGSVAFIGTSGVLSQDNANFFWNAASSRLGIGTAAPSTTLQVVGTNPLTLTGVQAGTSTTSDSLLTITSGLVRKIPMSTFATSAGITSLNGLTATTQTFALGTTGTDVGITSSGSTHTFNFPSASGTARGLVTTAAQTFAGAKSFTSTLLVSATNPLTLAGVAAGTSTTADSLLTITSGLVRKIPMSTFSTGSGITSLNGLTTATQTFATGTAGTDFNIVSSGSAHTYNIPDASATARGLVTTGTQTFAGAKAFSSAPAFSSLTQGSVPFIGTGGLLSQDNANFFWDATNVRLGVGTATPAQKLDVKGTIVSSATTYPNYAYNSANRIAFGETNVPANETGSVVQYGSGSSSRNMLFAFTKTNVNTSYLGNDGTQMMLGSEAGIPITFRTGLVYSSTNVMTSGTEVMRLTSGGLLGIGTTTPATALHVVGTNPLTLTGVQAGTFTAADSLLTITGGLVRKIPATTYASASNFWALGGNTVGAVKNFGTIDAFDLPFITGNTEKMRLSSSGNLGLGSSGFNSTNPEKLLIDQGTTGSFNAIVARGTINNYLQLNIQNLSSGTGASSDVVATADNGSETTNFIDMGINSSQNTAAIFGGVNDAYLYNLGQNLLVGTGTSGKALVFMTGGTTQSSNERMRIDGTGKVGIATNAPTAQLDVSGNFSLGANGSVNKNLISFEYALPSAQTVNSAVLGILALGGYAVTSLDITVPIPSGDQPTTTRASVNVSTDQDLPAGVAIAFARVASTSTVKIRFSNSNTANGTLPAGMKLWITINEF